MNITIAQALREATVVLKQAQVPDAQFDASLLLSDLLERDRGFLITHADDLLTEDQLTGFVERTRRRASGEPLQYITGTQEFFGLSFEVSPAVLIPRPETELIVEIALECIEPKAQATILDLGTGSGCITISILKQRPNTNAIATDLSHEAIKIALRNATRHGVRERTSFLVADALRTFGNTQFDLIVSNPPYVPDADWPTLQREVREHEPRTALTSGQDGLDLIRRLLKDAGAFLRPAGYFIFEIGYDQASLVQQLVDQSIWSFLGIREDLQGIPRTVMLQKR